MPNNLGATDAYWNWQCAHRSVLETHVRSLGFGAKYASAGGTSKFLLRIAHQIKSQKSGAPSPIPIQSISRC